MKLDIHYSERFDTRHNGPDEQEVAEMLQTLGVADLEQLVEETVPANIRLSQPLNLPEAKSEAQFIADFRERMSKNKLYDTFIGMGY